MIHSMTAYGSARVDADPGSLSVECRSVNGRFLDVHLRVPDALRMLEGPLRQLVGEYVSRGKLELRVNLQTPSRRGLGGIDAGLLAHLADQLKVARRSIPDVAAPGLFELLQSHNEEDSEEDGAAAWMQPCLQAAHKAMAQLRAGQQREGERLATAMLALVDDMQALALEAETQMPRLEAEQQERIGRRLRDALLAASPQGFARIDGAELSARIAQEAALFSLRNDVAEELARLQSHFVELRHLLGDTTDDTTPPAKTRGSVGKRLDFLCQELNREANTLGSKAAGMDITRIAIDLKLLIEQLREQVQNIE